MCPRPRATAALAACRTKPGASMAAITWFGRNSLCKRCNHSRHRDAGPAWRAFAHGSDRIEAVAVSKKY